MDLMQLVMQQKMGQIQNNPMYQQVQQMFNGKSPEQQQQIVMNLAKERGLDENALNQMAQQLQNGMR